ncbi:MAG: hypothetical protein U0326_04670 [Polyangiales bacterium]
MRYAEAPTRSASPPPWITAARGPSMETTVIGAPAVPLRSIQPPPG